MFAYVCASKNCTTKIVAKNVPQIAQKKSELHIVLQKCIKLHSTECTTKPKCTTYCLKAYHKRHYTLYRNAPQNVPWYQQTTRPLCTSNMVQYDAASCGTSEKASISTSLSQAQSGFYHSSSIRRGFRHGLNTLCSQSYTALFS